MLISSGYYILDFAFPDKSREKLLPYEKTINVYEQIDIKIVGVKCEWNIWPRAQKGKIFYGS